MLQKKSKYDFIAIGGSSGAINAISIILANLKDDFNIPIGIVLHRLRSGGKGMLDLLQSKTKLNVCEADDKEILKSGYIYLGPANYHFLINHDKSISYCYDEAKGFSRPSIDIFFNSAADVFRTRMIGIILSGANIDGTEGMQSIKQLGGQTIAQLPEDAQVDIMPTSVVENVKPHKTLAVKQITQYLNTL